MCGNMSLIVEIYNESGRKMLPKEKIKKAVLNALQGEKVETAEITIVFLDDNSIHELNKEYLNHDYPTDVISFCLEEEPLSGEVYISADTAQIQADEYNVSLTNELMRLSVHGTLHIIGYDDETDEQRKKMSELEDKYIGI